VDHGLTRIQERSINKGDTMAPSAADVEIPVPLNSGATDNPEAVQSGSVAPSPLPPGLSRKAVLPGEQPLPQGLSRKTAITSVEQPAEPASRTPSVNMGGAVDVAKRFGTRLGQSLGVPTNKEELTAAGTPPSIPEAIAGPGPSGIYNQLVQSGKTLYQGAKDTYKEAKEAGQNIAAGGPVLQNIAKPASTALNATVGAVPFIGAPTVRAGEDVAAKNYAGAAGGLTGVLGQVALEGAGERRLGTDEMAFHDAKVKEATAALKEAKKAATTNYQASIDKNIKLPKEVQKPIDTAQAALDEAVKHQAAAKQAIAERQVKPPAPEPTTAQVTAQPQAPRPAPAMRKYGTPEPPKPPMRVMEVPPEAAPSANAETAPKAETPTAPVAAEAKPQTERGTDRRQAAVPVEQERRVGERRNPAGIRVDAEGNPTMSPDVQAHWQGSAFGEKPAEDIGAKAREANPEPTRAETKEAPKAAPVKPAAVEEQLNRGLGNEPIKPGVPMKEQGKPAEPVKLSSEPRKAVLQKAGATDEEIAKILPKGAKPGQTGITKVEMSKLAEHFGVDMGASAIGRGKGDLASGTHMTQDAVLQKIIDAGHSPADIAKAIENGKHLSAVSGGSQGADTEPEYTDRGHGLHEVVTGPADNRIGHLLAHDMEGKPDTTQVASHWVDKEERGKGVGTSQLETLAKSLPEGKKTLLSDDEMTDSAKRSWDKFQSQHPEAVKKTAKGYSADLTKFDPNKFRTQTMEKPGAKKSPMKKM
jgi:hypothetical protein